MEVPNGWSQEIAADSRLDRLLTDAGKEYQSSRVSGRPDCPFDDFVNKVWYTFRRPIRNH